MKVLFLRSYFTPEYVASSYLTECCCDAFVKQGFDVLVYTSCPTRGILEEKRILYKTHLKKVI